MYSSPAQPLRSTTPARRRALLVSVALLFVALLSTGFGLAGCGLMPGNITHYSPPPAVVLHTHDCRVAVPGVSTADLADPASSETGSVPVDFVTTSVVLCRLELNVPSEAGEVSPAPTGSEQTSAPVPEFTVVEDHLNGDFKPLLAALAQPSDKARDDIACTADFEIVPALWLLDSSGQAVHVQWPTDACGKTRGKPGTATALAGLTVTARHTLKIPTAP